MSNKSDRRKELLLEYKERKVSGGVYKTMKEFKEDLQFLEEMWAEKFDPEKA